MRLAHWRGLPICQLWRRRLDLIYPLYAGHVQRVTSGSSYGNCVYIQHQDGYITLYAHMRTVYVKAGQSVDEDIVLGIEGATGNVTGKHLHVEVHKGIYNYPASIDPLAFIKERIGGDEVEKKIKIRLNGVAKEVTAIEKGGITMLCCKICGTIKSALVMTVCRLWP